MPVSPETRKHLHKLHEQYFTSRDAAVRSRLVDAYLPYARITAKKIASAFPRLSELERQDLDTVGVIGLLEAIDSFDPNRGAKFETYCIIRIRGAILDEIRRVETSCRLSKAHNFVGQGMDVATQTSDNVAQEREDSGEPGASPDLPNDSTSKAPKRISLDAPSSLEGWAGTPLTDILEDPHASDPATELAQMEVKDAIFNQCSDQEKLVVVLYYLEDLNMKQIGKLMGVSESRVSQMRTELLTRLRRKLRSREEEFLTVLR